VGRGLGGNKLVWTLWRDFFVIAQPVAPLPPPKSKKKNSAHLGNILVVFVGVHIYTKAIFFIEILGNPELYYN
jgi:hypothetical protein